MAILSKFARQLAKRVKKKGPPKTNAQKIDAMTSKLKKLEGQKTRRKEAAERNKREKEQKLAREKAFAKYQKKKQKLKLTPKKKTGSSRTKRKPVSMKPMTIKEEMKMLRAIGFDIYDTGTESGKYTDKELRDVIKMMRADDKVAAKKRGK